MVDRNGELEFPRFIDKPRLIGIFEIDEFFLAFGLMVTIVASSLLFPNIDSLYIMMGAVATGFLAATGYRKFKNNRSDGYTLQKLYRSGIVSPTDNKKGLLKYKYLRSSFKKNGLRMVPYGFTKVFYN